MADDKHTPGPYSLEVPEGDPYSKVLTLTNNSGEALELPTTGWRGQLQLRRDKNADVVDEWTIDASQAGEGLVTITLPELEAGVYYYDIECVGVRTFLAGTITVTKQVSD